MEMTYRPARPGCAVMATAEWDHGRITRAIDGWRYGTA